MSEVLNALLVGTIAWSLHQQGHDIYEALDATQEACVGLSSLSPTPLTYIQIADKAKRILEQRLTDTTRSGSVGDSTEDPTEGPGK